MAIVHGQRQTFLVCLKVVACVKYTLWSLEFGWSNAQHPFETGGSSRRTIRSPHNQLQKDRLSELHQTSRSSSNEVSRARHFCATIHGSLVHSLQPHTQSKAYEVTERASVQYGRVRMQSRASGYPFDILSHETDATAANRDFPAGFNGVTAKGFTVSSPIQR
ncbi:hypothetical protein BX600DRAFT_498864 [Xylariales sp. PMI_506]|nr:hypothetical protein BX600DRAFT_498864 [Xylariales sp. PMI_506]